jgi:hypothetical protein
MNGKQYAVAAIALGKEPLYSYGWGPTGIIENTN